MARSVGLMELQKLREDRLADAEALFAAGRYEGAVYLCGYAFEFALKEQICRNSNWDEYVPELSEPLSRGFRTHKLSDLLTLTGKEDQILLNCKNEWFVVREGWNPEDRYRLLPTSMDECRNFMHRVQRLIEEVLS